MGVGGGGDLPVVLVLVVLLFGSDACRVNSRDSAGGWLWSSVKERVRAGSHSSKEVPVTDTCQQTWAHSISRALALFTSFISFTSFTSFAVFILYHFLHRTSAVFQPLQRRDARADQPLHAADQKEGRPLRFQSDAM